MLDENVKVTAALVDHPPVVPSFAYRFDARDRSIVISGDTAPSDNVVKLARGADVSRALCHVPGCD
jgi:ribonuclease BN (tRNA processing enzyme)